MLASSPEVAYVHEPFNFPLWPACPLTSYFPYVTRQDERRVLAYLREVHGIVPRPGGFLGLKLLAQTTLDVFRRPCRPLVKEPYALFSAEWWVRTFDAQVVVLVRHPAAFAGSLKRLQWPFHFDHFRRQPLLLRKYLAAFRVDLERHSELQTDIIDDAILLWRLVYHTAWRLRNEHPEWVFLRHEDLSRCPVPQFRTLYARLGLRFTPDVSRAIEESSSEHHPKAQLDGEAHRIHLNSRANIWNWCQRLDPEEIERIRRGTEDVAPFFYTDADWTEDLSRPPQEWTTVQAAA
jgi:hypothetical protein